MKLKNAFLISIVLMAGLISSCDKNMGVNPASEQAAVANSETLASEKLAAQSASTLSSDMSLKSTNSSLETVNLGLAGEFAILSKTGITSVYKSSILGDIGTSPITGAAITLSCDEVTGSIFSVDAAGPACKITSATRLGIAVLDMQAAYTDAAGRSNPDYLNLGAGTIGGKTLTSGLYNWSSSVEIPTDITISGNSTDIFIFQVAGNLNMNSAVRVTLEGGAQAKNIFWVVAGSVTFGTTSHFEGNILGQTAINMKTGATLNGRMLAQTAVTLQMSTVVKP
ncbi:ice-binding protein [Labilibaculum antarcticum]|uniref:DUF3494 domain-containing protein n=1 Tax=Labilibaculum antarcticum TaxID=1717717 RepID=A0A1Y1CLL2_9BACT|nr:ice-binding protein [Labilibaculum antarcticum]BAX81235.1 hypothetical protein ALGA_2930 [Labilibaculum antarcticum]